MKTRLKGARRVLMLQDHEVLAGEKRQINLDVVELPSRTRVAIPVFIERAEEPGPSLLLLAGLHGDETNGVEILRHLLSQHPPLRRGTLVMLPLLNVIGFLNLSRELPDGRDINRSFPGSTRGSLASRIASLMIKEILPIVDHGVDFHTGGGQRSNHPQIRCLIEDPTSMALAEAFGPPFILHVRHIDRSLRKEAARAGVPILVYEGGETLRRDPMAIEEGIAGALRVMGHLGMIDAPPPSPHAPLILRHSGWVRARVGGLFTPLVMNAERVHKNQLIGKLHGPYGDLEVDVRARAEGHVICVNNIAVVNQGDALFHIGHVDPE